MGLKQCRPYGVTATVCNDDAEFLEKTMRSHKFGSKWLRPYRTIELATEASSMQIRITIRSRPAKPFLFACQGMSGVISSRAYQ